MQTTIIVGVVSFAVIGLLIFFLQRSSKKEGRLEERSESQQDIINTRKETDEHKRKTKNNDRDSFIDM
jgi:Flp pilus assembly protein TadB